MANEDGHQITSIPVDIAKDITSGTKVKYQNISGSDILLFEGTAVDRDKGDKLPNILRGPPFFDFADYTIGSDSIWAYTLSGDRSALAVSY